MDHFCRAVAVASAEPLTEMSTSITCQMYCRPYMQFYEFLETGCIKKVKQHCVGRNGSIRQFWDSSIGCIVLDLN